MELKKAKEIIRDNIQRKPARAQLGGQCCGIQAGIKLESEDLGITIVVETYRSELKNMELAVKLFDAAIDETVK